MEMYDLEHIVYFGLNAKKPDRHLNENEKFT